MGSRPHKTTTTRRREKREERRAKSEERRKKRKETPKEAAKGPQMRPPEGGQPFSRPSRPLVGPLAASRAEGREQRKERREKKKEKTRFFCFSLSAEGVFPKDSMTLGPSRWLAVAARGRPDPPKPQFSLRKTSIFEKTLFCIRRRLEATRRGLGK